MKLILKQTKERVLNVMIPASIFAVVSSPAAFAATLLTTQVNRKDGNIFSSAVTASADNLTTLGTTDWGYYAWSGTTIVEANSMNGGNGLGALTSNKTTGIGNAKPNSNFTISNGGAPVSGSGINSRAGLQREGGSNPPPVFSLATPVSLDTTTLYVRFSSQKVSTLTLQMFDSLGTQIGSTTTITESVDRQNSYLYRFDYSGDATGVGVGELRLSMVSGQQNDAILEINGAALAIPEPTTFAMLMGAMGMLIGFRRR